MSRTEKHVRRNAGRFGRALIGGLLAGAALMWSWNLLGSRLLGLPEGTYIQGLAFVIGIATVAAVWRRIAAPGVSPPRTNGTGGG